MNSYRYQVIKACAVQSCGARVVGPSKYCVVHKVDAMRAAKRRYQMKQGEKKN